MTKEQARLIAEQLPSPPDPTVHPELWLAYANLYRLAGQELLPDWLEVGRHGSHIIFVLEHGADPNEAIGLEAISRL